MPYLVVIYLYIKHVINNNIGELILKTKTIPEDHFDLWYEYNILLLCANSYLLNMPISCKLHSCARHHMDCYGESPHT